MNKRTMYIALLLIAIGIAIWVAASFSFGSLQNQIVQSTTYSTANLTVKPDNYASYQLQLNGSYLSSLAYVVSPSSNLYLFNTTAYSAWLNARRSDYNASGIALAKILESKGAVLIAQNVTLSPTFNLATNASGSNITYNSGARPSNSTYYLVIDNTKGSGSLNKSVQAGILYAVTPIASLDQFLTSTKTISLAGSIPAFLILVIGIILLIYGALRRSKLKDALQPEGKTAPWSKQLTQQEVDELYKNVGKKQQRTAKTPKRRRRRSSTRK